MLASGRVEITIASSAIKDGMKARFASVVARALLRWQADYGETWLAATRSVN
jgi:hypothetical protein